MNLGVYGLPEYKESVVSISSIPTYSRTLNSSGLYGLQQINSSVIKITTLTPYPRFTIIGSEYFTFLVDYGNGVKIEYPLTLQYNGWRCDVLYTYPDGLWVERDLFITIEKPTLLSAFNIGEDWFTKSPFKMDFNKYPNLSFLSLTGDLELDQSFANNNLQGMSLNYPTFLDENVLKYLKIHNLQISRVSADNVNNPSFGFNKVIEYLKNYLTTLTFYQCWFNDTNIPNNFGELVNLNNLYFYGNTFTNVPPTITTLPNLNTLALSNINAGNSDILSVSNLWSDSSTLKNSLVTLDLEITRIPGNLGDDDLKLGEFKYIRNLNRRYQQNYFSTSPLKPNSLIIEDTVDYVYDLALKYASARKPIYTFGPLGFPRYCRVDLYTTNIYSLYVNLELSGIRRPTSGFKRKIESGVITLNNNSSDVVGNGTFFISEGVTAGDIIELVDMDADNYFQHRKYTSTILSVNSETSLTINPIIFDDGLNRINSPYCSYNVGNPTTPMEKVYVLWNLWECEVVNNFLPKSGEILGEGSTAIITSPYIEKMLYPDEGNIWVGVYGCDQSQFNIGYWITKLTDNTARITLPSTFTGQLTSNNGWLTPLNNLSINETEIITSNGFSWYMIGAKLGIKIDNVWYYKTITEFINSDIIHIESKFDDTTTQVSSSNWNIFGITIAR